MSSIQFTIKIPNLVKMWKDSRPIKLTRAQAYDLSMYLYDTRNHFSSCEDDGYIYRHERESAKRWEDVLDRKMWKGTWQGSTFVKDNQQV